MSTARPLAKGKPRLRGCRAGVLAALILSLPAISAVGQPADPSPALYKLLDFAGLDHLVTLAPADIPPPVASDDAYATVQQKIESVQTLVKENQPATFALTADDVNSLIAHNPALSDNNVRAYFSFANDEGRLQTSIPTDVLTRGVVKGRYFNMDISFNVSYDSAGKSVNLTPTTLKVGDETLLGAGVKSSNSAAFNTAMMTYLLNFGLRQNPQVAALLDQTQNIAIKNGELVIQTK
jgi:hypothetical protein